MSLNRVILIGWVQGEPKHTLSLDGLYASEINLLTRGAPEMAHPKTLHRVLARGNLSSFVRQAVCPGDELYVEGSLYEENLKEKRNKAMAVQTEVRILAEGMQNLSFPKRMADVPATEAELLSSLVQRR